MGFGKYGSVDVDFNKMVSISFTEEELNALKHLIKYGFKDIIGKKKEEIKYELNVLTKLDMNIVNVEDIIELKEKK